MSSGSSGPRAVRTRLAIGMIVFGSATPVSKLVIEAMPAFVGALLRVGVGALVLAPFVVTRWRTVRDMTAGDWVKAGVIALFGMFGFTVLLLYGMRSVSGAVGAIVMSTAPAVTAAASMLFVGDRPTWRKFTAIALAVAGVLLLHLGGGGDGSSGDGSAVGWGLWLGIALVFGAVCCEACYTLVGKSVSESVDPLVVAFLAALLALPIFVPFAIGQWSDFDPGGVGAGAWSAAIWYGAGTLALGSWLWYSGIQHTEGTVAAAFMGLMPASALGLSYLLLDQPFRWIHPIGFIAVFAGVMLIAWEHGRMARTSSS